MLLRRIAVKPAFNTDVKEDITYWMTVGSDCRAHCETMLLKSLEQEQNGAVRRRVCDTIAEIAKYLITKGSKFSFAKL